MFPPSFCCFIAEPLDEGVVIEPRVEPRECAPYVANSIEIEMNKLFSNKNDDIPSTRSIISAHNPCRASLIINPMSTLDLQTYSY